MTRVLLRNENHEPVGDNEKVAYVYFVFDGREDICIHIREDGLLAKSQHFGERLLPAGPNRGTSDLTGSAPQKFHPSRDSE